MKQWLTRLITIAVVLAVGFWVWQKFFPSTEKLIRNRVARVAKLSSFTDRDGNLTRMADATSLIGYFTPDIACVVETPDIPETGDWTVNGRDELREVILASRSNFDSLHVDLMDVTVTVAPDRQTASAELTARISLPHDKDFIVHEMKFTFRNANGDWLISRIETVKTLK